MGCGGKPVKQPEKESAFDTSPDPVLAAEAAAGGSSAASGSADRADKPENKKKSEGPVYPAPFTWEQIRAASKSGRAYRYKVEVPGKPSKERVLTFVKVDDDGAEIYAGGENPKRMGWPTLQKHAEFPKSRTTVREETVKLQGGKFDCMVYEVRGDDAEVSTYYFAKTLPGAPVMFYVEQDGKRVRTTSLIQHIQGN